MGSLVDKQLELDENSPSLGKLEMRFALENGSEAVFESTVKQLLKKQKPLPPLCNPPILEGIDDLTNLSHLNEPAGTNQHYIAFRLNFHSPSQYSCTIRAMRYLYIFRDCINSC